MRAISLLCLLVAVLTVGPALCRSAVAMELAPANDDGPVRAQAERNAPGGPPAGEARPGGEDPERARNMAFQRRGQTMQWLEDADVRAEIGLTPEQEQRINDLREKATSLFTRVRDEYRAKYEAQITPDMTDEEKQALRQEAQQGMAEAMRTARGDLETLMNEADTVLTPEQKEKLAVVSRERAASADLTGGLSALLTSRAREECGISRDQVEQIRIMCRRLENDAKGLRDHFFGAGKEITREDRQGEDYKDFQTEHQAMIKKTRDRIMTILTGEQREKVEKFLASSGRNRGGNRRDTGGRNPSGGDPNAAGRRDSGDRNSPGDNADETRRRDSGRRNAPADDMN